LTRRDKIIPAVEVIMGVETVLITGASSGIGRELAKVFAADGCRLILVARKRHPLQELADELRQAHKTQSEVLTSDLSQPSAPPRIFEHLQANGTRVDVLVNNAGFGAHGQFAELPVERQLEMIQVNITSLTYLSRLMLPGMLERRRGGVLNVASTAGFQPGPSMAAYYATKAFVLSLSEAIAEEIAGTGVTVTALCPGPTETNFAEAAGARFSRLFLRNAMSAEAVAREGHRAFRAGKIVAICGFRNQMLTFSVRLVPRALVRKIVKALNASSYKS
jgi:short-subunit dehydrogenase